MINDWNNARNIAVNSLLLFEQKARPIQETLDRCFSEQTLDLRERALASELAYGSCRHLITLDALIKTYSTRRFPKIDKLIRQILRVGLYQMLFLDRTPDFAAVHKAVEQAKASGPQGSGSFVNAILRGMQREIKGPITTDSEVRPRATLWRDANCGIEFEREFLPDPNKQKSKYYSIAYSHPVWLMERWLKRYDEATLRSILVADNARPRLTLRVNRLSCTPDKLSQRLQEAGYEHEIYGHAIILQQSASPEQLPGYEEGWFFVQDWAAMSVGPKTTVAAGNRVLDLCAAPGGKCTHLAELMGKQGEIIACDVSRSKLDLIEVNCRRLGISIVRTCLPDELETIYAQGGPFDMVLVDAPCSNTGVLARRVEVRHRLKPVDLQTLKTLQLKLLRRGAKLLRTGGRLIYTTCSIEPAENEDLVQTFLRGDYAFEILNQQLQLPGQTAQEIAMTRSDGGYLAVLRKYSNHN